MKKNFMMRAASVLLVAVMLTTCAISGTFAKYVTSADSTDSARVAKFGVEITANGETFAKEYATDDAIFTETNSVISTDKVVAPGTDGTMASMTLTGTPEVAVRVSYDAEVTINDKWVVDGDNYFPIKINVNGTAVSYYVDADVADIEAAIETAIKNYSKDYPAGTDLSSVANDSLAVTWEWPFSTSADNDVKDTKLGDAAVTGDAGTISIAVTTTVTQID